ncbi:ABC transporter permease [Chlamydia psittaci]|uniref:Binding--dependent transport system inner membrane component family protein n=3 Tax=Chlamydia psittaci TaxID=83554 RepID=A0ABN0MPC8_CHLPS|nr:ABC transporter permease [Chlamydia psittaci]AFS19143.1 binding--dependent transport system inner membrane component family protein [Chlamydia psittaci 84/55]AFS22342.1 binding--dependent transport system inner membrane component family protein [Chlamydia psittaci VS225]AGE74724.1 putative transport protein [Chlamydia psittaci Mat116]EPJ15974.1 binding--dependent transport system inner membrane component family protein [Chlamydia psittaci 02DC18]EPJ25553.1 binding--dependent transport syste
MLKYILKRLILIPLTLFAIISINFIILNAAPGDVIEDQSVDSFGDAGKSDKIRTYKGPDRYLQFREHYGLTLPIFFNTRPAISHAQVKSGIEKIVDSVTNKQSISKLKIYWGDRAKFILPALLFEANDNTKTSVYRHVAADLFIRGAIRQGIVGPGLSPEQYAYNERVSKSNASLVKLLSEEDIGIKVDCLKEWFRKEGGLDAFPYKRFSWKTFFLETRFSRYMSRVLRLDFGTLRNDPHKTVVSEVVKRLRSSLTLSVFPMILVFILCQVFGMIMALNRNRWIDHTLNFIFLFLFSVPVFVSVPWIIDNFVINKTIPFTSIPMPYSGLQSPPEIFNQLSSLGKILDTLAHSFLPFCAVSYGAFASQSRLSRSVFLEILGEDYICAARARGVSRYDILVKHVGKNAASSLITSLASSLGAILGGALVVETLFDIDGFGKFFYQAILNRDHNVVLFSVLVGSALSLLGYLIGDICYVLLDPRVQLGGKRV